MDHEQESTGLRIAKAAVYLPTLAALTVASVAVHTSIGAVVGIYNALWRRKHRQLGPALN